MAKTQSQKNVDQLCALCASLYPDEWPALFRGSRETLRDFLNSKTGLSVDHTVDKGGAITAWIEALK